jgi:hypothetical protein
MGYLGVMLAILGLSWAILGSIWPSCGVSLVDLKDLSRASGGTGLKVWEMPRGLGGPMGWKSKGTRAPTGFGQGFGGTLSEAIMASGKNSSYSHSIDTCVFCF